MKFKCRSWLAPSSHRQVQKAPPPPLSLLCQASWRSRPWVETTLVPLHPLCDPPFHHLSGQGYRLPSEPSLLSSPGLGAVQGLPGNNAGTPSGAQVRPLLCVFLAASQPSPDGPMAGPLWWALKGGFRDRTMGAQRTESQTSSLLNSLAVYPGRGTVSSTGTVLSPYGD